MDFESIRAFLMEFQDRVCTEFQAREDLVEFQRPQLPGERGGLARPRTLDDGRVLERVAVNFSHTGGESLPAAATTQRPELVGAQFDAVSVSMISHPRNPYAPTSHANFRLFVARPSRGEARWWFGGGFDLTPYYGFDEDAAHWHRQAEAACRALDSGAYARFKAACDDYFVLPHRDERRGVGGIFFDDLDQPSFDRCADFFRAAADAYLAAYFPILDRRIDTAYGERERHFQLLRRGRYVEFNLLHDRGTRYGLQAGGRTESILASLPPLVRWSTDYQPAAGTPEARLLHHFLVPRDWISSEHPQ